MALQLQRGKDKLLSILAIFQFSPIMLIPWLLKQYAIE